MRIVVPVDGSAQAQAAVSFIASRSTLIGTDPQVVLLNVQPALPARVARQVGRKQVDAWHAEEAQYVLKPAKAELADAGIAADARWAAGQAGEQIGALAEDVDADLIVMGAHGHSAFKGLVVGSVTNATLVHTRRPLLLLRSDTAPKSDSLSVGIAIDGSRIGREAVKYVLRHGALFGAKPRLTVLHVVPDFAAAMVPDLAGVALPAISADEVAALQRQSFEQAIGPVRALLHKAKVQAEEVCLAGNPGDELAAFAKKRRLDLLVMGTHGYGALKAAVMGSVATRVAARCTTPLLLVR